MASGSYLQLQTGQTLSQVLGQEFQREKLGHVCGARHSEGEGHALLSTLFQMLVNLCLLCLVIWTRDGGMGLL